MLTGQVFRCPSCGLIESDYNCPMVGYLVWPIPIHVFQKHMILKNISDLHYLKVFDKSSNVIISEIELRRTSMVRDVQLFMSLVTLVAINSFLKFSYFGYPHINDVIFKPDITDLAKNTLIKHKKHEK